MIDRRYYTVWLDNNVESNKVAEFETLQEAKEYCDGETAGRVNVDDRDNDYESHGNNFHLEVYEGEPIDFVYDEDGEVGDEKATYKEPVYQTRQYYCD